MQRSLVLGLGATILAPIVSIAWIAAHSRDLPDAGDADLAVEVPVVAPNENGFERVRWAAEAMRISDEEHERVKDFALGHSEDQRWVKGKVAENADSLAELGHALSAPSFVYPPKPEADPYADPDGAMLGARKLAWLARADARRLAGRGSPREAMARVMLAIRLGRRFAGAWNPSLVEMLDAQNLERIGLAGLAEVTRRGRLGVDEAARLEAELEASRIPAATWANAWAMDYQARKSSLVRFRSAPDAFPGASGDKFFRPLHRYVSAFTYQPIRTAAAYAENTRILQRSLAPICTEAPRFHGRSDPRKRLAAALLRGNVIGVWFTELEYPKGSFWSFRRCETDARNSLVQTALALRARWDAEHTLPESLDELVPRYLAAVPRDPFGGGPILYDRKTKVLHSIGSDFADKGGAFEAPCETDAEKRDREEREPTVSVDFE